MQTPRSDTGRGHTGGAKDQIWPDLAPIPFQTPHKGPIHPLLLALLVLSTLVNPLGGQHSLDLGGREGLAGA